MVSIKLKLATKNIVVITKTCFVASYFARGCSGAPMTNMRGSAWILAVAKRRTLDIASRGLRTCPPSACPGFHVYVPAALVRGQSPSAAMRISKLPVTHAALARHLACRVSVIHGDRRFFSVRHKDQGSAAEEQTERKQQNGAGGGGDKSGTMLLSAAIVSMVGGGMGYYINYAAQERPAGVPRASTPNIVGLGMPRSARATNADSPNVAEASIMEPVEFSHPLNGRPVLVRWWVTVKRVCWLMFVFTPFAFSSGMLLLLRTQAARERWIVSLISSFEAAGCSFQKFGQWMSMRPDMLPPDVIDALSKLRMDVPTHSMAHNEAVVRAATGQPLDEIFSFFDPRPMASGTVAQVHRAVLNAHMSHRGEATEVAVKVRHPNVEEETFIDIDLIFAFINTLGEYCGHFSIPFKKEEFHVVLQRQIDFRWEGHNLARFGQNFDIAPHRPGGTALKSSPPMGVGDVGGGSHPLNSWRSEAPPKLSENVGGGKCHVCTY